MIAGGILRVDDVAQIGILLLDIRLHVRVDGRIDLIAAGIDAVECLLLVDAVGLHQVGLHLADRHFDRPRHLCILRIVVLGDKLRMQLLVLLGIREDQVLVQGCLILVIGDRAVNVHLPEDIFLTCAVALTSGVDPLVGLVVLVARKRVDGLRRLRDRREDSALRNGQILDVLAEILDGRHLDAVRRTAEADEVQVGLHDVRLGVVLLQRHGTENFAHLTGRGLLVVARHVLDELLGDGRTTTLGIPEVEEQVRHCRDGILVVHAVVGVETLVLGVDERIEHMLRDLVDLDRDTLDLVLYRVEGDEVAVRIVAEHVRVIGQLHFLELDRGGFLHQLHDIDRAGSSDDRSGDDADHEDRKQRRKQDGEHSLDDTPRLGRFFLLGSGFAAASSAGLLLHNDLGSS